MGTLKIKAVGEVKTARDGRQYFPLTVSAGFGLKDHSINIWEVFARDNSTGLPLDGKEGRELKKIWERGTRAEAVLAMQTGEKIEGAVVTAKVVPYSIREGEPKVDTYTTIVFADQNPVSVFAQLGHNMVEESGEVLGNIRTPKAKIILADSKAETKLAEASFSNADTKE